MRLLFHSLLERVCVEGEGEVRGRAEVRLKLDVQGQGDGKMLDVNGASYA